MGRSALGTLYKKTPDAPKWSGAFAHPTTGKRVLCTLYSDKQASRVALDRMIKEAERSAEGLEDPHKAQRRRPIAEHVTDYLAHCRHEQQDEHHIRLKEANLHRLVERTRAKVIDDLTLERVTVALRALIESGRSARTHNHYRAIVIAFLNWMVEVGRVESHTFNRLPVLDERRDRRRQRRALTTEELERLLHAARLRPLAEYGRASVRKAKADCQGRGTWTKAPLTLTTLERAVERAKQALNKHPEVIDRLERLGRERALIYKTLVLTGLRVGELRSLTTKDAFLDHTPPFVRLAAESEKARRGADVPLRMDLAREIKAWLEERSERGMRGNRNTTPGQPPAAERLFAMPSTLLHALHRDLKVAGIPKRDERGRTVDLHALRHTFGTHLSRGGVFPRTAQAAMRHSTIDLTMGLYVDPKLLEVAGALDALPGLGAR